MLAMLAMRYDLSAPHADAWPERLQRWAQRLGDEGGSADVYGVSAALQSFEQEVGRWKCNGRRVRARNKLTETCPHRPNSWWMRA